MSVISYNDFFKKKKKKEDEDDIAPTKKSGSVISLEDFAKENNLELSTTRKPLIREGAGTSNADGYVYTGRNYGDYWYQDYARAKDNKIYQKNGGYFVYDEKSKTYQNVDRISFLGSKDWFNQQYEEAKKLGYTGSKSDLAHISDQLKLDTVDLTPNEREKYEKDLLRQQENKDEELRRKNEVHYSGTGLKGAWGEIKHLGGNVVEKIDDGVIEPITTAKESYDYGKKTEELGKEYYKMMMGEENNAKELEEEIQKYSMFNQDIVNSKNIITQSIQSTPNQIGGLIEGVKGGGIGGTVGAIGGAILGAITTKSPQGAIAGATTGAKWLGGSGYVAGQTKYTYELEAGLQYKALLEMGVPEDIAKKEAKNVGTINALIESGESILDIVTLGKTSKLTGALKDELVKKYGSNVVSSWSEKMLMSQMQNTVSEAIEESLQEKTAIESEKRATEEAGIIRDDSEDWNRIKESAIVAAFSSFFGMGAVNVGTNAVGTAINNKKINDVAKEQIDKIEQEQNITLTETQKTKMQQEIVENLKHKLNSPNNLTKNEQKIVEKEVENIIKEEEKDGKKLSNKEIKKIEEQVINRLKKGDISTDLIESEFGGEEYNAYKSILDKQNRQNELLDKKSGETSNRERLELEALTEELKGVDINTLKSNLENSMGQKIQSDGFLKKSYQEKAKRSVKYEADLSKYDAKQQETIKKAMDSGILNDTTKTHEFVDMIAKISADKGVSFDFANNQKLKESGFAIEGKQINGFVNGNNITLNMDSSKALNKVVGHEITHILEGTELYKELQDALMEYDITKKEYGTRYNELKKLYKGVKDADIKKELTADLVGDYIFNDPDFVNSLSVKKPSLFKIIYDEIKYLLKIATAGSKEARQLEKAKKIFDKAYKENASKMSETDTMFSISDVEAKTKENMSKRADSDKIEYIETDILKNIDTRGRGNRPSITEEVKVNGITEPLIITINDYGVPILEDGNHRLEAAIELGMKEVPVKIREANDEQTEMIYKNISELNTDAFKKTDVKYSLSETGVKNLSNELGISVAEIESNLSYQDEYGVKRYLTKYTNLIDKYMQDNNINVEPVYKEIEFNKLTSKEEQQFAIDNDLSVMKLANDETLLNQYIDLLRNKLLESKFYTEEEANETAELWRSYFELAKHDGEVPRVLKSYDREFEAVKSGNTRVIDNIETDKKIQKEVIDSPEFQAYLDSLVKPLFNKPQYTDEEIMEAAIENHGTTDDFNTGAYMTLDGQLLNFNSGGYRDDHRTIDALGVDMNEFMEAGAIRMQPETPGFELIHEPTKEQYSRLYDYIDFIKGKNETIFIDIVKSNSNQYDNAEYSPNTPTSKIINDIKEYYRTGSFPKQSEFAQFRYSLSRESEQVAPVRSDIFGSDIKLQVEEAIAPIKEEIAELKETIEKTVETSLEDEYAPMTEEEFNSYAEQDREAFRTIDETSYVPEIEEDIPYQPQDTTSIDDKSLKMLSKNIKSELGLDKYQTSKLEGIIQDYSTGKIETKEELYNEIKKNFSEYTEQVRVQEIKDVQNDLRNTRINVSKNVQDGIKDYYRIKQKNFGKIKFAKDGLGVDSVYQELSTKYPDYFPTDIDTQSDQFLRMVEVANMQNTFNEKYVLPNEVIQEATDFITESVEDYKYNEWMKAIDEYSKLPIDDSTMPVEEIVEDASNTKVKEEIAPVRSKTDWDSIEAIDPNTAKQLTLDGTEEDLVKKTKKELRKALLGTEAQKEFITNVLDNAKNRSMALMNNTDTIRNNELVFGRDAGKIINDVIFQKEIDNEADSIAWQNRERDDIKALGIKARSKESAAVQKYGEKQYVNDAGGVIAYGDNELASEFKDAATQEKIKRAAQLIRNKYDNYIDLANGVLTKLGFEPIKKRNDYMRHFQELNDVFSRYGIPFNAQNMDEHTLPTDINGLTEFWSPQKNYFANMQARKGVKTTYDAITGIDGYIGGIANLIYHTEDIQRGRAFEELIRETYGEDKGFDNLENLPDELKQARIEKIQDNHLSNYAAWVHEWTNNVAGKKSKIDRSVEAMFGRKAFALLDETRKQVGSNMIGFNLSSSLTNLIAPVQAMAKTNKLAVLKGTADTIKNMFVKDNFMDNNKFLVSRMGSDMISKNAWQKIQDAGFIFMKGMDWFSSNQIVRSKYYELRSKGMSEAEAHAEAGKFAARILGDRTKGANAQLYNSKLIGLVTQFQLEVNNQLYSMFYDTYHESKENAQNNALKTAAGMTFTLGQLFVFTHLFGKTFEAIAGYNPTLDVIEILKTAFGWGEDEEDEEKTTSERLKEAADQLVDSLPYVNILTGGGRIPVASGIPNLVGVATGGKDEYGNELTLEGEMKKLLYLLPPTGGNQIKKTYQGLSMFDDDLPVSGSYTDSGNLRFPVEDTVMNRIQAGLFGQYANENAGNYFDNKRQPLKEKQIQEYADLDLPIADYWEYREGLKEQSTTQEKFDYINSLDVSDEQKNIMINNALDRKEPIDMSNYGDFGGYDEFDYATKNPDKYRVIEQIDTFDNYVAYKDDIASIKEQFSSENGYSTEQRKAAVQKYIQSLNLSVPQKIMLEKMAGGYSIKSYKNYMQSYIESLPLTTEEKQTIDNQLFK